MNALEAVRAWRQFATSLRFVRDGVEVSWAQHIAGPGRSDEETTVQPVAFPRFAETLLGFTVGQTLAAERVGDEGRPDFTPADSVTHPFVFETKPTAAGVALEGFNEQVGRYLRVGRPRIKQVVLTNLVGVRVFSYEDSATHQRYAVNLRGLLEGDEAQVASLADASRLRDFLDEFAFRVLTSDEKIARIRAAPDWNPFMAVTTPEWITGRVAATVEILQADVRRSVAVGGLRDQTRVSAAELQSIVHELRTLEVGLGADPADVEERSITDYESARVTAIRGKALQQYEGYVAYYTATRLLLVRIWQDLGLLAPVLYDGGFDHWMNVFNDVLSSVVRQAFAEAEDRYRALFAQRNNYTWYRPTDSAYTDALYGGSTRFGVSARGRIGLRVA